MKKSKHDRKRLSSFVVLFLGIILVVLFFIIVVYYIPRNNRRGTFFHYDEILVSSNGRYIGVIDISNEKVSIVDHSGKEVSYVDIKEQYPNQIALGNSSYFLLYRWESENGAGKIVQYDYQSNKIKECKVSNIATISCRNQYLFIGDWRYEEEEDDKYENCYFLPFYNGFYANRYIREEQFGNQLKKISVTQKEGSIVGGIKMYYHKEGFFSTEPIWDDYPGTSIGDFTKKDKVWNYQAETKQEMKNRDLLLKIIGNSGEGIQEQEPTYLVCEYQCGDDIYGVCNVLEQYIPAYPLESKDVIKSYCYNINREDNEIKIMAQKNSCIAIIATSNVYIYQKDNLIIRQNIKTGDQEIIYEFPNYFSLNVNVQGDYLLVSDKNNCIPIKWNAR